MKEITLKLTAQEINLILESLAIGQYRIVKELIDKIDTQASSQLEDKPTI